MNDASTSQKISVLVAEDSPSARDLLVHIFNRDPGLTVAGTASNGEEAVRGVLRHRPDVIAMDLHMPFMDGLEATRKIMETCPTPIVVVSGSSSRGDSTAVFRVLEAGALALMHKPKGMGAAGHEAEARTLVQAMKSMSEVKVVRRWPKRAAFASSTTSELPAFNPIRTDLRHQAPAPEEIRLVAIGASTGGPLVLKTILSELPKNFHVPVLIVQHIAPGFTQGLADWLAQTSGLPVHVAADGQVMLPGHVYIAPDGLHAEVQHGGKIALSDDERTNGHRPSVSHLFRSVARTLGRHAIGVLLTGMGKDGAEELKMMKDRGATTIAQDQQTSVVYGMPGVAMGLDAATYVASPEQIARLLASLTGRVER